MDWDGRLLFVGSVADWFPAYSSNRAVSKIIRSMGFASRKSFVTSEGRRARLAAEGCGLLRGGIFARQLRCRDIDQERYPNQITQLSKEKLARWILMEGKVLSNLEMA